MKNIKSIAIIPARGGSKRIPKKKHKRDFLGKPIIAEQFYNTEIVTTLSTQLSWSHFIE